MTIPSYILPDDTAALFQTASRFPDVFRPRGRDSHKGTYGTLAVIGGAQGMSGAVVLAATAAAYAGCGKVWAGFNQEALPFPVIAGRPEIMLSEARRLVGRKDVDACAAGCGMGLDGAAHALLADLLDGGSHKPLLLDADALTLLAHSATLRQSAQNYGGSLVLTPHPAEAARLLAVATADIQSDRAAAAAEISRRFGAVVVLKGHRSLVCTPEGVLYANESGNPGLASAGSGDVLAGVAGSLLAQGIDAFQAVCAAVWLHGAAADLLRASGVGEAGMLAGEIAPALRYLRNFLCRVP